MGQMTTLVDLLRGRAVERPDRLAFQFLADGETVESSMTYEQLDRRARAVGAALQSLGGAGERVILLYPPGLEFVAAFFGCLYAGATAVPVSPPRRGQEERMLRRFLAVVSDARPRIALGPWAKPAGGQAPLDRLPGAEGLRWLATADLPGERAEEWAPPELSPDSIALLQYTSGSTAAPKGVMVSHGNILHNERMIQEAFSQTEDSVVVGWLPVYHDMGLIGNVIQPIFSGSRAVLMSPMSFLQRPLRWPLAISTFRGTTSGGPSFAYDLVVRRTTPEQRAALDLRSWRVAFNGAEPVRSQVLDAFSTAFAECGFSRRAFHPCYGLAEATLLVSAGSAAGAPRVQTLDGVALERHEVVPAVGGDGGRAVVSCGLVRPEQRAVIVAPESLAACPPGRVGEIWISGPAVARGYWDNAEETRRTFEARLEGSGDGPFLRTGDLGFVADGELYVTGRVKDLIIVRGTNHYPQDVEWTAQGSHPWLRRSSCVAFSVEAEGEERLVIVAEIGPRHEADLRGSDTEAAGVVETIRRAVAEEHGLQAYAVALAKAGEVPKTTSGKLERLACRAAFLEGRLELLGSSVLEGDDTDWTPEDLDLEVLAGLDSEDQRERLERYLRDLVAAALRVPRRQLDVDRPLDGLGVDSLRAIELSHRIETDLGVAVSMMPFVQGLSIAEIAALALREMAEPATGARALAPRPGEPAREHRLSYGQEALWFIQRLAPESSHYNIAAAARITARLELPAFERALQGLADRHPCLRTTFSAPHGKPLQKVAEHLDLRPQVTEAADWSEALLARRMADAAYRPFDLQEGPLLRLVLFRRSDREHVAVLAVHHIVADFWSLTVLLDELGRSYAAELAGRPPALEPLPLQYADFVAWQAATLAEPRSEAHWQYWRTQLAAPLAEVDLPSDRPRPARQTYHGASLGLALGPDRTASLEALAAAHRATLFSVLLTSFQVLLHRYTGQDDVVVGSPMSGRPRAAFAGIVGYFVNPVVLRSDLAGDPAFQDLLGRTRQTVLEALEHQDYPFALLVERLQPARDPSRSPLFQVMFILQQAHQPALEGLSPFALGETGERLDLWGLPLESMALERRMTPFDLTLTMARARDGLKAFFEYNGDLFDADSIARMAEHFRNLVDSVLEDPARRLSLLELMGEAERRQVLREWNETRVGLPRAKCAHQRIESQVRRIPDAVALVFGSRALTFRGLDRRANQLARHLGARGVGPGDLVGIYLERSPEMVIAMLGTLKAGAAYVPLDPAYPRQRTAFMLEDSRAGTVLTRQGLAAALGDGPWALVRLDADWPEIGRQPGSRAAAGAGGDDLAYVIYTSGSTGEPKGVMVRHRAVVNFFRGMDRAVGCDRADGLLAVTSMCFDISVLELLWTLSGGARVVLTSERASRGTPARRRRPRRSGPPGFSLFYFANADPGAESDKYRLLLEGAKLADDCGFEAVWTPERHFHAFGGLYPSPSVIGGALAAITRRVEIRAGSVVLPLHDPIRVAEEWSVLDNLSGGRVGVSFASGWHVNDFALAPDRWEDRKGFMYRAIETVQRLWHGESIRVRNGAGDEIEVSLQPRPLQAELPIWITASGNPDTFVQAGAVGANLLTHLLGQTLEEVAEKVATYRESRARHGHDPRAGRVTLMLHAFVGTSMAEVREKVREPLTDYLRTSLGLISSLVKGIDPGLDLEQMSPADKDDMLAFAFDRYVETSGLFGTPEDVLEMAERVQEADVDEIACLIDFGVDADSVMESLHRLGAVVAGGRGAVADGHSLPELARDHRVSLFQCTPSLMKMLSLDPETVQALGSVRILMLGGEALPRPLVDELHAALPARLVNMYGPTETTIWSTTAEVGRSDEEVSIGRPIANTRVYVLDRRLQAVPVGVTGELFIGGAGLARGYLRRPALTAEKFLPDPFGRAPGGRLYRTGDLARFGSDGRLACLGRVDQQTKVRGFRIELGEIEAVLGRHPHVREAAVVARTDAGGDPRLVAYVVAKEERAPRGGELRDFLGERLPAFMVPGTFVALAALPLTPNGKLDRKALPVPTGARADLAASYVAPETDLEQTIAAIWRQVLGVDKVGIHDNFFDLGGHSLLMAQVQSQLKRRLHEDLPLVTMLEYPTVSALARHLSEPESALSPARSDRERAALQRAGLWRQSRSAIASRQGSGRSETA